MFGIGFTELIVVLVVALIVIGPDKLPAIAKSMGKAFVEFRRVGEDLKKTITDIDLESTVSDIDLKLDSSSSPAVSAAKKKTTLKRGAAPKKKASAPGSSSKSAAKSGSQSGKKVT